MTARGVARFDASDAPHPGLASLVGNLVSREPVGESGTAGLVFRFLVGDVVPLALLVCLVSVVWTARRDRLGVPTVGPVDLHFVVRPRGLEPRT
jgi:hypothetical protein